MLILTTNDLRQVVPMDAAIEAVASAFAQLSSGQADVPLRPHVTVPPQEGLSLVMPAYLVGSDALAVKLLTLFPHNPARHGLPSINALVVLFDTTTGVPLALMDGSYLTALRTGAASGVATRYMAREDANVLALFGAGAQAPMQAWAACVARPIKSISIFNRTTERAERLVAELCVFGPPIPDDIQVARSAQVALAEASVICCATASPRPVFDDVDLQPGAHINAVGSYRPTMQEIPAETVARARVVVDQRQAAWAEAGDLVIPRDHGLINEQHVVGELGEVVLEQIAGRTSSKEITLFKSVGNAVQDVAVAALAYARAREQELGTEVSLT
jgi:ornithine cyclodeaminase/alanine dehydrogenase-like protein (mu-crystallin family)